jgi:hypothetical protein
MFFRYVQVMQEGGQIGFERTPCLSLVLPWSAMLCRHPQLIFSAALQHNPVLDAEAVRRSLAVN